MPRVPAPTRARSTLRRRLLVGLVGAATVLVGLLAFGRGDGILGDAAGPTSEAFPRESAPPALGGDAPTREPVVAQAPSSPEGAGELPAPPTCAYEDRPAPLAAYDQHAATPLDTRFRLSDAYVPPDLVPLRGAGFEDDRSVRRLLLDDLAALRAAAEANGTPLEIQSAYRSYAYQARVFDGWVAQLGREHALATSARPGHSEHQLGTAIDVRSRGGPAPWTLDDWAATPAGAWMAATAWRYGFVMSYPDGAADETCYAYEPWHYRWVGRDEARRIHERGVSLRRWLWRPTGPLADVRSDFVEAAP